MPKRKTVKQLETEIKHLEGVLAYNETDPFFTASLNLRGIYQSRENWDREKILEECLRAWRVNPLARRIVKMTTSFVIGGGVKIKCDDLYTDEFIQTWWTDRQNNFTKNFKRWMDEQTRSGNHFFVWTVIPATGMSYVRAVPSDMVKDIQTKENDIEQEIKYVPHSDELKTWSAYNPTEKQDSFMTHEAVNQPIGNTWGEPDLAPILPWLGRYATWLEDRVRLNHFRSAMMYILKMKGTVSEPVKKSRAAQMNANPIRPGTVFVQDESEDLGILAATLDAFDSSVDGATIKKMIAVGTPFPLHYLAEPESATRTTAEAAGTPTFRSLQDIQDDFFGMLKGMAYIALQIRARADSRIDLNAKLEVEGADITEKDNAVLALALNRISPTLFELFDREAIDAKEMLRIMYRFIAEVFTGSGDKAKRKPLIAPNVPGTAPTNQPATEPDPGEPEEGVENSSAVDWRTQLDSVIAVMQKSLPSTVNITNQLPVQEPPIVNVTNDVQKLNL